MKAIVVKKFGDYSNLEYCDFLEPIPKDNEVLVSTRMIGVNFSDSHLVDGTYLANKLPPFVPGFESSFIYKNKICFGITSSGSYAEKATIFKDMIFELPESVKEEEALALLSQGVTAYHLSNTVCRVKENDFVLINGASSGVGIILSQLCKNLGANVFALTSSIDKKNIIESLGIDNVYIDLKEMKKDLKNKFGINKFNVIFEMYGGKSFKHFYNMLDVFGNICFYGSASRDIVDPVFPQEMIYSSKTVSSFWLANCIGNNKMFNDIVLNLLNMVINKDIKIIVGNVLSLKNAKEMHKLIKDRKTFGKLILNNIN